MTPETRAEQIGRLRAAIARSGLSARQYAKGVLLRDERTIRRWLAGTSPIPQAVLEFLTKAPEAVDSSSSRDNSDA